MQYYTRMKITIVYAMTAQLSWHVQICDLLALLQLQLIPQVWWIIIP